MNLFVLVEGRRTEKKVYQSWIAHAFPDMEQAAAVEGLEGNHYFLLSGNGYPAYLERIRASLEDIEKHGKIDCFLICIDTEEEEPEAKRQEITAEITCDVCPVHVILQNPCIETWFLGNRAMMKRHPQSQTLREWKRFYDVSQENPEKMGCPPQFEVKAEFHLKYLKEMLAERNQFYTKKKPGCVTSANYLEQLIARFSETGDLTSFGHLLKVWREFGCIL